MMTKKILNAARLRRIEAGFSFIPHRFLTDEFLAGLTQPELVLYFFLVLAADRDGISFYSYNSLCRLLHLSLDDYIDARDGLIEKELLAFDGTLYQVLALPEKPKPVSSPLEDPARVRQCILKSLQEA